MGKHKGQPKKNWADAVKSAADKALEDKSAPGNYTLQTVENVQSPQADVAPIRDYTVTLDGPH